MAGALPGFDDLAARIHLVEPPQRLFGIACVDRQPVDETARAGTDPIAELGEIKGNHAVNLQAVMV